MRERTDVTVSTLDVAAIRHVLEDLPVTNAILYGSHARGEATEASDVDLAVTFDDALSSVERTHARLELIECLSDILETDDVDVVPLSQASANLRREISEDGVVIYGDRGALNAYLRQQPTSTHEERLAQFDDVLANLEQVV